MTGAPFLRDLDDVRRWPTIADLNMFHMLSHMSPALHSPAHHIVEQMDIVVSHRHLRFTCSSMKDSDKTFMGMTTSGRNAEDVKAMCEILFGADVMEEAPVVAQLNAAALPTLAPYADVSQGRTRDLWALPVDRQ